MPLPTRFLCLLAAILTLSACRATLRPSYNDVLARLGKTKGVDAGKCSSPGGVKEAYQQEIESKGNEPLANTLLPFAQRAAKVCPQARPFLTTSNEVDLKDIAPLVGGVPFEGDGNMQMEPWLFLRVIGGKVVGLEVDLGRI